MILRASILMLLLTLGCASRSEPLPTATRATNVLHWSPVMQAAAYRPYYLSTNVPDFALTTNSVNWTRLPETTATNALLVAVPAGSLVTVIALDGQGGNSDFAAPVTNPPVKTVITPANLNAGH